MFKNHVNCTICSQCKIYNSTTCCSVFSVTSITLIELGILPDGAMLLLVSRVLFLVVTMGYYYHLGRKVKKTWALFQGGTAEHRSQTRGQNVWNIIWLGLGALLCQWMPPFHGTSPIVPPIFNRWAQSHIPDSATRTRDPMVEVHLSFTGLWGQAPLDTHSSFVPFWVLLLQRRS